MLILHVISLLSIFVRISDQQKSNPPTLFYFDVVDCGEERLLAFDVSLTPYPALIANEISLWLAGEFRPTSLRANVFAKRVRVDDFVKHAQVTFYSTDPSFGQPFLNDLNNTYVHVADSDDYEDNLVTAEFLQALHRTMLLNTKSTHFIPYDMNELNHEILQIISHILTSLPSPPQYRSIGINLHYNKTSILCGNWKLQTALQQGTLATSDFDKRKENFFNTFTTPKLKNSTVCPPNSVISMQTNQKSVCKCQDEHRAGPFCAFQCIRNEMIQENTACDPMLPSASNKGSCDFTSLDYSLMCLRNYRIPLLKGNISATTNDDFNSVSIHWQLMNYFAMAPHVLQIRIKNVADSTEELHQFSTREFYLEGYANTLNVTHTCDSEDENEGMGKCKKLLKLQSFSQYTMTLGVRYIAIIKARVIYITVGTTTFTTAEVIPGEPSIAAKLSTCSNELNLRIDWRLEHCPGFITGYSIHIGCKVTSDEKERTAEHADSDVTDVSIQPVDCRNPFVFPYSVVAPLSDSCAGQMVHVQMRIATRKGFGPWSRIYSLPVPQFPPALAAWIVGLIVLAVIAGTVLVFAVPLSCFYKKNREFFKTWWKLHNKPKFRPPPMPTRSGAVSSNEYASPHDETPATYQYSLTLDVGLQPRRIAAGQFPSVQSSYYATIVHPSNSVSQTTSGYITPKFE